MSDIGAIGVNKVKAKRFGFYFEGFRQYNSWAQAENKQNIMKYIWTILITVFYLLTGYSQGIIDDWQKSTVSLGVIELITDVSPEGKEIKKPIYKAIGTGILFYVKVNNEVIPTLVTAKHVFEDSLRKWKPAELQLRFSWFDDKPVDEYFGFRLPLIEGGKKNWFAHDNPEVDLAAMPLLIPKGVDIGIESIKVQPYSQIATQDDLYEGANVFVLGYPGAIGSEYWTKALVRQGIISWVSRSDSLKSKILIDCDVFPGNSGGPVFYIPIGIGKDGNIQSGGEIKFLGIISQRRFSPTEVVDSKTQNPILIDSIGTKLMSFESIGIGIVEPAMRVKELLRSIEKELEK